MELESHYFLISPYIQTSVNKINFHWKDWYHEIILILSKKTYVMQNIIAVLLALFFLMQFRSLKRRGRDLC